MCSGLVESELTCSWILISLLPAGMIASTQSSSFVAPTNLRLFGLAKKIVTTISSVATFGWLYWSRRAITIGKAMPVVIGVLSSVMTILSLVTDIASSLAWSVFLFAAKMPQVPSSASELRTTYLLSGAFSLCAGASLITLIVFL